MSPFRTLPLLVYLMLSLPLCPAQLQPTEEEKQFVKNPTVVAAQNSEDVRATHWSVESPGVGGDIPLSWLKPAKWSKGRGGGVEFERPRGSIGVNAPQGQPELSENEFSRLLVRRAPRRWSP